MDTTMIPNIKPNLTNDNGTLNFSKCKAHVLVLSDQDIYKPLLYTDINSFTEKYTIFSEFSDEEKFKLFKFTNYLLVALKIIPVENNRDIIINVALTLTNEPQTSSSFSTVVDNHHFIFNKESGYDLVLMYIQCHKLHENTLGKSHPETMQLLCKIAEANYTYGNISLAISTMNACINICKKALGSESPMLVLFKNKLLVWYFKNNQLDLTINLSLELETLLSNVERPQGVNFFNNLLIISMALIKKYDYISAKTYALKALDIFNLNEKKFNEDQKKKLFEILSKVHSLTGDNHSFNEQVGSKRKNNDRTFTVVQKNLTIKNVSLPTNIFEINSDIIDGFFKIFNSSFYTLENFPSFKNATLKILLSENTFKSLNGKTIENLVKEYFETFDEITTRSDSQIFLSKFIVMIKSAYIYILSTFAEINSEFYTEFSQLVEDFPDLDNEDSFYYVTSELEKVRLIKFRNYMFAALQIVEGKGNKGILMKIATVFEDSGIEYCTGGNPNKLTLTRINIYEQLSGCQVKKRPKKAKISDDNLICLDSMSNSSNLFNSSNDGISYLLDATSNLKSMIDDI